MGAARRSEFQIVSIRDQISEALPRDQVHLKLRICFEKSTELRSENQLRDREGDPATVMFFVLSGEVHLRHDRAAGQSLVIGRAAQVTGLLPFSRMKFYTGTALAVDTVCVLEIVHSSFDDMLNAIPTMNRRCVAILLDRAREVTRIEQQTEKLAALGKLAGNLAHELNNPASAVKSSARNLLHEFERQKLLRRAIEQGGFSPVNSNSCISGKKSSPREPLCHPHWTTLTAKMR